MIAWVEEAETSGFRATLGFSSLDDFVVHGLELSVESVQWAIKGLAVLGDNRPVGLEVAVTVGQLVAEETIQGKHVLIGNLPMSQLSRAERNGHSIRTQRKLDYLYQHDRPSFEAINRGEGSISRAYDESRGLVKTPLDHLRHWWGKATEAERETFLADLHLFQETEPAE